MDWKTLLACITGSVDEELRLRNEYLVEENHILRQQSEGRIQLTDAQRRTLAEIGFPEPHAANEHESGPIAYHKRLGGG